MNISKTSYSSNWQSSLQNQSPIEGDNKNSGAELARAKDSFKNQQDPTRKCEAKQQNPADHKPSSSSIFFPGHPQESLGNLFFSYATSQREKLASFIRSNQEYHSEALAKAVQHAVLAHLQSREGQWSNNLQSDFSSTIKSANLGFISDEEWVGAQAYLDAIRPELDFLYPPNVVWENTDQQFMVLQFLHGLHFALLCEPKNQRSGSGLDGLPVTLQPFEKDWFEDLQNLQPKFETRPFIPGRSGNLSSTALFPGHSENSLANLLKNYSESQRTKLALFTRSNHEFHSEPLANAVQHAVLAHLQSREGLWSNDLRADFGATIKPANLKFIGDEEWVDAQAYLNAIQPDLDFLYPPKVVWENTEQQFRVLQFVNALHFSFIK